MISYHFIYGANMATIHSLELFISVYTTKNITETAKQYYCSQPSVSRCIKDLEEEYHTVLFERYHHKLLATPSADILYTHALRVLNSYNSLEQAMLTHNEKIRIGSTVTMSNTLLPKYIQHYSKQYPSIRIEVSVSNGENIYQDLLHNAIDIAFIENMISSSEVVAIPFYQDELVLLVPNDHPFTSQKEIPLSSLNGMPFLHREQGSALRQYLDEYFKKNHIHVDTLWQSRSTHAIIHAVESGLGITILPKNMCIKEIENHSITQVSIASHKLIRPYYLVYPKEKKLTDNLVNFIHLF